MVTREQVVKSACRGGTMINTAGATSAIAMVTIVNLETAMRLYATVDHLTLDRIALLLVSSQLRTLRVLQNEGFLDMLLYRSMFQILEIGPYFSFYIPRKTSLVSCGEALKYN